MVLIDFNSTITILYYQTKKSQSKRLYLLLRPFHCLFMVQMIINGFHNLILLYKSIVYHIINSQADIMWLHSHVALLCIG